MVRNEVGPLGYLKCGVTHFRSSTARLLHYVLVRTFQFNELVPRSWVLQNKVRFNIHFATRCGTLRVNELWFRDRLRIDVEQDWMSLEKVMEDRFRAVIQCVQ